MYFESYPPSSEVYSYQTFGLIMRKHELDSRKWSVWHLDIGLNRLGCPPSRSVSSSSLCMLCFEEDIVISDTSFELETQLKIVRSKTIHIAITHSYSLTQFLFSILLTPYKNRSSTSQTCILVNYTVAYSTVIHSIFDTRY